MKIQTDTVAWDEAAGFVTFQVSHEGKTFRVRCSDAYLQDGFACHDPDVEYESCILGNTDAILAQVSQKVQSGDYPDGATLDFLDF